MEHKVGFILEGAEIPAAYTFKYRSALDFTLLNSIAVMLDIGILSSFFHHQQCLHSFNSKGISEKKVFFAFWVLLSLLEHAWCCFHCQRCPDAFDKHPKSDRYASCATCMQDATSTEQLQRESVCKYAQKKWSQKEVRDCYVCADGVFCPLVARHLSWLSNFISQWSTDFNFPWNNVASA